MQRVLKRPHSEAVTSEQNGITQPQAKRQLFEERQRLPIYEHRQRLIQVVREHRNVVLVSATGSGKTTQLPQLLYHANVHKNKVIAVTQPRRVAAVSIATRVAEETGCTVGQLVGYRVRFEDTTSEETRIKFLTDGMLIREAVTDPALRRYSVLILDEAHERSLNTDVLFGIVKAAHKKRLQKGIHPFKVIVMSATIDPAPFVNFLGTADTKTVFVEGRQHPLELHSLTAPCRDYVHEAAATCLQLHRSVPLDRVILIFLTGEDDIERCSSLLTRAAQALAASRASGGGKSDNTTAKSDMVVLPLMAALPQDRQIKAMTAAYKHSRKVIVSTNIAETSVTIPGVRYVIDSGLAKQKSCELGSSLESLTTGPISKAQSWQRAGRAARESAGLCYRLYTDQEYNERAMHPVPELQRSNLAAVLLQLVAMGIQNIRHFEWISPPSPLSIEAAIRSLRDLKAVVNGEQKDTLQITSLGNQMVSFPLDPRLSRVLLRAAELNCLVEVLTIISMLYVQSVYYVPPNKKAAFEENRVKFSSAEGDLHTLLALYRGYMAVKNSEDRINWCRNNFVNHHQMKAVIQVRKQLKAIAIQLELKMKSCHDRLDLISRSFITGFVNQIARLQRIEGSSRHSKTHEGWYSCAALVADSSLDDVHRLYLHPSSVLFPASHRPELVLFVECVSTTKLYMRQVCQLRQDWLVDDGDEQRGVSDAENDTPGGSS